MLSDAPTGVPAYAVLIWLMTLLYFASPVVSKFLCWAAKYVASAGSAALVRGGDRGDDGVHVCRVVPAVRIAAVGHSDEGADVDDVLAGGVVGREQLGHPRVVADAVLDDDAAPASVAGVCSARVIVVRVGVGVRDDALNVDLAAAELGRDRAPEVLGRHDVQRDASRSVAVRCTDVAQPVGGDQGHRHQQT